MDWCHPLSRKSAWQVMNENPNYSRILNATRVAFMQCAAETTDPLERLLWRLELDQEEERIMGVFSKAFNMGQTQTVGGAFTDVDFAREYPTLSAFVTSPVDDDGKQRVTSTVMIFCEQGTAKACLKERDHALTLWVSSQSILGLFRALEDALGENPIAWRSQSGPNTTRRVR